MSAVVTRKRGLLENMSSCVFIISLAISGEETMMLDISPSFRCIRGPYLVAKFLKERWGIEPKIWCKFPMRGSFHGPGGKLVVLEFLDFDLFTVSNNNTKGKRERKKVKKT